MVNTIDVDSVGNKPSHADYGSGVLGTKDTSEDDNGGGGIGGGSDTTAPVEKQVFPGSK